MPVVMKFINIVERAVHRVGYWSTYLGLSVSFPEVREGEKNSSSYLDQKLGDDIWPGGKTER